MFLIDDNMLYPCALSLIFKLVKYQRGHKLYLYAISLAIATTTLKFTQFRIAKIRADIAQW